MKYKWSAFKNYSFYRQQMDNLTNYKFIQIKPLINLSNNSIYGSFSADDTTKISNEIKNIICKHIQCMK